MVQSWRDQNEAGTSVIPDQLWEISSPESMISQGKYIIGGIWSRFVNQFASPNYYEPVETGRWKETPITMWLKRLGKIIYDHMNCKSTCECVGWSTTMTLTSRESRIGSNKVHNRNIGSWICGFEGS